MEIDWWTLSTGVLLGWFVVWPAIVRAWRYYDPNEVAARKWRRLNNLIHKQSCRHCWGTGIEWVELPRPTAKGDDDG